MISLIKECLTIFKDAAPIQAVHGLIVTVAAPAARARPFSQIRRFCFAAGLHKGKS
jgi:hypothetical protein